MRVLEVIKLSSMTVQVLLRMNSAFHRVNREEPVWLGNRKRFNTDQEFGFQIHFVLNREQFRYTIVLTTPNNDDSISERVVLSGTILPEG